MYNSVNVLLNFARNHKKWSIESYAVIACIASDQDIENLSELSQVIEQFVQLTNKCVNNADDSTRQQFKDTQDSELIFQVRSLSLGNGFVLSIDAFLSCLFGFAINDKFKLSIFNQSGLRESLKTLITDGNDVEKYYAIELLAQLAFNSEINKEISKDTQLIDYIKELNIGQRVFDFKRLTKSCANILWILTSNKREDKDEEKERAQESKGHIMISYNTASRDLCLKIKNELEKLNLKIWIDVSEMHDSTVESMATAIENAQCVLMCVTEKYRQSVNCQAEAKYAFRLQKQIIPLILQSGYANVEGWLGFIISDKIFIDFTKYKFEDAMNRLLKQIMLNNSSNTSLSASDTPNKTDQVNAKDNNNPTDWTEEQCRNWFIENKIQGLFELMTPIDGGVLYQLYEMKKAVPEFFFKSITKNESADFKSVAVFANSLIKLFDKK